MVGAENTNWSDWISAIAAVFSFLATSLAAWVAYGAKKLQKAIAKSSIGLVENELLLKNFQTLIATFAEIVAVATSEWSSDRTERLRLLSDKLKVTEAIIGSLDASVGDELQKWRQYKDSNRHSICIVVNNSLAFHGAIIGSTQEKFLGERAHELKKIQKNILNRINDEILS